MRGVIQSRTGESGTCFRASLASILNLRESQVPDFPQANQDPGVDKFLARYGLRYEEFPITDDNAPVGYHFILGVSPRGGEHAIVGKDGRPVWDPHPASDGTGQGLVNPERYGVLINEFEKAKDALLSGKHLHNAAEELRSKHDEVKQSPLHTGNPATAYNALRQPTAALVVEAEKLLVNAKLDDDSSYWRAKMTAAHKALETSTKAAQSRDYGKVVCPDCADRRARLHRALDSTRADYERVASLQPTEVFQGNEYWQVGSDMYRNPVGNRGPIEPIGNTGKPGNARWECSVRDFPKMKKAYAIDSDPRFGVGEKVKYSGNVYKVITILPDAKYLIERIATGRRFKVSENSLSPYAGLPKLSAKDARRARLHRALDCVMDRARANDVSDKPLWKQINETEDRIRSLIDKYGRGNSKLPALKRKLKDLQEAKAKAKDSQVDEDAKLIVAMAKSPVQANELISRRVDEQHLPQFAALALADKVHDLMKRQAPVGMPAKEARRLGLRFTK